MGLPTATDASPERKSSLLQAYRRKAAPGLWVGPTLAGLLVGLIFCIAGPVYMVYRSAASPDNPAKRTTLCLGADNKTYTNDTPAANLAIFVENFEGASAMLISMRIVEMKAATNSMRLVVDFTVGGDLREYSAVEQDVGLPPNQTLAIQVGRSFKSYATGTVLDKLDLNLIVDPLGATGSYPYDPMDSYGGSMFIGSYVEAKVGGKSTRKPIGLLCLSINNQLANFDAQVDGFDYALVYDYDATGSPVANGAVSALSFKYSLQRTITTKFFSIFIVVLMWGISGSLLALAIDHLFLRPREPLPPTIGMTVAMMFALPSLRNVQPDVPMIGSAVDVLGFFWNMSMVAFSVIVFAAAFIGFHKPKP